MFKKFDAHARYFQSVALMSIIAGASIVAIGIVEMGGNLWWDLGFTNPFFKIVAGFIVISLGYIHLELEIMRTK